MSWRGRELFEQPNWPQELTQTEAAALQTFADRDPESITRDEAQLPELTDRTARLSHELEQGSGQPLLLRA